jgi:predicted permease
MKVFRVILIVVGVLCIVGGITKLTMQETVPFGACRSVMQGNSSGGGNINPYYISDCHQARHNDTVAAVALFIIGGLSLVFGVGHIVYTKNEALTAQALQFQGHIPGCRLHAMRQFDKSCPRCRELQELEKQAYEPDNEQRVHSPECRLDKSGRLDMHCAGCTELADLAHQAKRQAKPVKADWLVRALYPENEGWQS